MNQAATMIFLVVEVTPFQAAMLFERRVVRLIRSEMTASVVREEKLGDQLPPKNSTTQVRFPGLFEYLCTQ